MKATVPLIEIADDAYALGIGRPHGEQDTVYAVHQPRVAAEKTVGTPVMTLAEQVMS